MKLCFECGIFFLYNKNNTIISLLLAGLYSIMNMVNVSTAVHIVSDC